jgi:hypothetical protein
VTQLATVCAVVRADIHDNRITQATAEEFRVLADAATAAVSRIAATTPGPDKPATSSAAD